MRSCQRGGMQTINLRHLSQALVLLAVPALLAAGCGGTASASNKPSRQAAEDQALKYTQCMQQHGIDVQTSANGNQITTRIRGGGPDGQGPGQQQIQAAMQACRQYEPNGGQGTGQSSAQQMDQISKFVQCMNQHGVPVQQHGGVIEESGRNVDPNKKQQAVQACQKYAPGGGGGQSSSGS